MASTSPIQRPCGGRLHCRTAHVSGLGGDQGVWPGPEVAKRYVAGEKVAKVPRVGPVREPVVLKPYVARAALVYQPLTDEELAGNVGSVLIFDTECFSNFFLVAFKHLQTGHVLTLQVPLDIEKLHWLLQNYILI